VRNLNDAFDEYGDSVESAECTGKDFESFQLMSFWTERIGVSDEAHAKALAAAATHRVESYAQCKDDPFYTANEHHDISEPGKGKDTENDEKKKDDEKSAHVDDIAPAAFGMADMAFNIPLMDESLLQVPGADDAMHSDSEGGEGGGPGIDVSDDEADDDDNDEVAPAMAAVAAVAAPVNAQNNNQMVQPLPPAQPAAAAGPGMAMDNPGAGGPGAQMTPSTKSKSKAVSSGKKLYFWQRVVLKEQQLQQRFAESRPLFEYWHTTHGQYGMAKQKPKEKEMNVEEKDLESESEDECEWKEPDFDELLSKPLPKYRWGIQYNYDLEIRDKKEFASTREYLMIDDRVKRGKHFEEDAEAGDYKSDVGIVLKIEQWDDTRLEAKEVKGDRVYLTWSSSRPFRFNYRGMFDVEYFKRGQVFAMDYSHIRVGDRVCRGFSWTDDLYHAEDGGQGALGTVVSVQYVLQVTGVIAKVRWHKNGHENLYSWGFKKVYDIRRVSDD